ncbi:MAG: prolipoprotein diacylglyceryl transferase [Holosporales bacterium]|jgi:phosphatidylglycerol:prolipoprotein diacylglycerol transferase|nr:prolipoprotein diacylglyceryl transferase [Holosporales bacterium]
MFTLSISPIAFSIGALNVYWYGIVYASALLLSWCVAVWALNKLRNNGVNVPSKEVFDKFMFWAIISIIIGARLGHVLFFDLKYYMQYPSEIIMLRNGGLSFHGAVISLVIYSYLFIKKYNFSLKLFADILCLAGALGIGIGRFANFINQELYGKISTSNASVIFLLVDHMPRYPTQIFESFFEGFLNFWILFIIFRLKGVKIIGTGVIVSVFCTVYSSARFIVEFYKEVETYVYFDAIALTIGQTLSITLFLFGVFMLHWRETDGLLKRKNR